MSLRQSVPCASQQTPTDDRHLSRDMARRHADSRRHLIGPYVKRDLVKCVVGREIRTTRMLKNCNVGGHPGRPRTKENNCNPPFMGNELSHLSSKALEKGRDLKQDDGFNVSHFCFCLLIVSLN